MTNSRSRRRSPAVVVTIITLFTLAAVAEAEAQISTAKIKRIARSVANQQITIRAPGLSVGSAVSAQSANAANSANTANSANFANSANTANTANSANFANSANPVLFARVGSDGIVDPANSKGVASANVAPTGGLYCFSGLPAIKGGQVTADFNATIDDEIGQFGLGTDGLGICPPGTQFFVAILRSDVGVRAAVNGGFFLHLYQ